MWLINAAALHSCQKTLYLLKQIVLNCRAEITTINQFGFLPSKPSGKRSHPNVGTLLFAVSKKNFIRDLTNMTIVSLRVADD